MKMDTPSRVLITGLDGFTGIHLREYLVEQGFEVFGLKSDLTYREGVLSEVSDIAPEYVIHLAGISFTAESDADLIYRVNVIGSINLLDALKALKNKVNKVILASSASVYGNLSDSVLSESLCPKPLSHYGCSKLSMEYMAQNYMASLPILITRPFNYTGIGHAEHFLIPKIIKAYKEKRESVELGNLDVFREFNDVRDICHIYYSLLTTDHSSETVNICSGNSISLSHIIALLDRISGYKINVKVNPAFVRANEIKKLSGSTEKLSTLIQCKYTYQIEDTLRWMYKGDL
jgi:nucleoside-diphosphate-sugar epimerase